MNMESFFLALLKVWRRGSIDHMYECLWDMIGDQWSARVKA